MTNELEIYNNWQMTDNIILDSQTNNKYLKEKKSAPWLVNELILFWLQKIVNSVS